MRSALANGAFLHALLRRTVEIAACSLVSAALLVPRNVFAQPARPTECDLYTYRATVTRVIDGDTVVADIDLGFRTWRHGEHLRLYGIDAPEIHGEERKAGLRASEALRELVAGKPVLICTIEDCADSFGRYLVRILAIEEKPFAVNPWLILNGYAVPYEGATGCKAATPLDLSGAEPGGAPFPSVRPD